MDSSSTFPSLLTRARHALVSTSEEWASVTRRHRQAPAHRGSATLLPMARHLPAFPYRTPTTARPPRYAPSPCGRRRGSSPRRGGRRRPAAPRAGGRGRPGAGWRSSSAGRARAGPTWWRGSRPGVPIPGRRGRSDFQPVSRRSCRGEWSAACLGAGSSRRRDGAG